METERKKEHMEAEQSRSAIYPTTNDVNNLIRWCGAVDEQDESFFQTRHKNGFVTAIDQDPLYVPGYFIVVVIIIIIIIIIIICATEPDSLYLGLKETK